jgi:4'-phosphopantetheinyl transferase
MGDNLQKKMKSETEFWQPSPPKLDLPDERVDIWRIAFEICIAQPEVLGFLSRDEIERASRFHFERHRARYANCRAALRQILGRYLRRPPGEIRFCYEVNGKPELVDEQNEQRLRFNISHSSDLAMLAVSCSRAVGVDVERIRDQLDCLELARRFFSQREYRNLIALPPRQQQRAFFTCWTRKEALVKACGAGLSYPLADFSVSVVPDGPATIEEIRPTDRARWHLRKLEPGEDYVGAVVFENPPCDIALWQWNPS